jgi:uncharacterized UPF0160 family protein
MFKKIVTHNGPFHADDVFGVAMLGRLEPYELVRTRDASVADAADYVVDVGGVYDAERGRFDHHQPGRAGARPNGVQYSAAGLIWRHHGRAVVRRIVSAHCGARTIADADLDRVAQMVDETLVVPICATDNGQRLAEGRVFTDVRADGYGVSQIVGAMNPSWIEAPNFDAAFEGAVHFATGVLIREIIRAYGVVRAEGVVAAAIAKSGPHVVELDQFVPWQDYVVDTTHTFAVYPGTDGKWMVQAVPEKPGSFISKRLFPAAWSGLKGETLAMTSGVVGAVFCHPGRFIAGAETREGALALARQALVEVA